MRHPPCSGYPLTRITQPRLFSQHLLTSYVAVTRPQSVHTNLASPAGRLRYVTTGTTLRLTGYHEYCPAGRGSAHIFLPNFYAKYRHVISFSLSAYANSREIRPITQLDDNSGLYPITPCYSAYLCANPPRLSSDIRGNYDW